MSLFLWSNNASTTLAGPVSSVATSLSVATGTGAEFPSPGAGQQFSLTLNDAATGLLTEVTYCTARSGDTMTIVRGQEGTTALNWSAGDLAANLITAGALNAFFQQGTYQGQQTAAYLEYVSGTSLKLMPHGGDIIVIDGSIYSIPSSGIAGALTGQYVNGVAGQSLAASTVYDVFVFNNSGTLTFDFWSTGGHMTDTSTGNIGVEVRNNSGSPDSTRSYVGKIATSSAPAFQPQGLGVISWFNRKNVALISSTSATGTTTSTSPVEIDTASRVSFLSFGDSAMNFVVNITGSVAGSSTLSWAGSLGLDGTTNINDISFAFTSGSSFGNQGCASNFYQPTEGQHYVTPLGNVNAGTTTLTVTAGIVTATAIG